MKSFLIAVFNCLALFSFSQDLLVRNVNLIPMTQDTVAPGMDVWISAGKISAIASTGRTGYTGTEIIDGTGKYLMPGLMDMHVHFFYEQGADSSLLPDEAFVMLANGVTTARVMCGDPLYLNLKNQITEEKTEGPQLIVASPQMVGMWKWDGLFLGYIVTNEEEGRAAVRRAKQEGYDQIKITMFVRPDTYFGIIDEAKKIGMKVTGHIGPDIKLPAALAAGQQVEHYDEFMEMLLPDTLLNHGISVSGGGVWDRENAWPTMARVDSSLIPALVDKVKAAGIYITPTNFFLHSSFGYYLSPEEIQARPDYNYFPNSLKKFWADVSDHYWSTPPPEAWRLKYIRIRRALTYQLWKAGVPLMTGSDAPDWHLVPGFSTHDEMKEFSLCGLDNFAILQTATIHPAAYLGMSSTHGTVEAGKEADLLLLTANPLGNIENTKQIEGVIYNGAWISSEEIAVRMAEIKIRMAEH